ncbi:glutaredoxin family protein [Bacillus sp. NPDC077411]|uniref:Glutaredoxin family protein n=1 Tax=Bacillus bruguierae TaxID=3127667 RepID=A0ABU8FFJ6_9BACI|nr:MULTISPECIES: glutaredoxin family protein [unclassified Bacillus (in: firmicutes)]SFJ13960.1 Glutaredoxin [Bacillus sp. 71mf]SFT09360.1 Glutaredoxin [Bacillus sp. 103mf]
MEVILYTKEECGLCQKAKQLLQELKDEYVFDLKEIDIYEDEQLLEKYHLTIPVVEIEGEEVGYGIIHKDVIMNSIIRAIRVE